MPDAKYNSSGIAQTGPPMNQSPASNPGVVYQPANTPTNPGSFKVATKTGRNLTFVTKNSSEVNIGTLNNTSTPQGSAGVEVIDSAGDVIVSISDNSTDPGTGDSAISAQDFVGNPVESLLREFGLDFYLTSGAGSGTYVSTLPMLIVENDSFNDLSPTALFSASDVIDGPSARPHFGYLFELNPGGIGVYVSDGTDPNGSLSAVEGSICLNASGTGQISYNTTGSTVWSAITGSGGGSTATAGRMYLNSAQSIANSTQVKVALDTANITHGITCDGSNNRITATAAGTYYVSGQVTYNTVVTNKNLICYIYLNGSQVSYDITVTNGTIIQTAGSNILLDLNVNDYVELWTFHNNGTSEPLETGSEYTYLQAFKV